MIRRSGILDSGGKPLVFSARSVTSLFLIRQLNYYGFYPVCVSGSKWSQEQLSFVSPARVLCSFYEDKNWVEYRDVFTHIFDPFFDLHIDVASVLLKQYGTYITYGVEKQHPLLSERTDMSYQKVHSVLAMGIPKLLTFKGHCLGSYDDLKMAIDNIDSELFCPVIDGIYPISRGVEFLVKSFVIIRGLVRLFCD